MEARKFVTPFNQNQHQSFQVVPNKINFILGKNGSGKTSFVNSILRFYQTKDAVFIDSIDIMNFSLKEIRSKVRVIFQENLIINDNLAEIIAEIDDFKIIEFMNGFSNVFSDKEFVSELSGGQKQLLSFFYTLSKSPKILIIDEGFSNMDTYTLEKCMNFLYKLCSDILIIIISHDLKYMKKDQSNIILFN